MRLVDSALIVPRLRLTIENLFQVANQAAYLGILHPAATPLTRCVVNRLHCCLDDLGQIVQEIEQRRVDPGCLTLEDVLILEGYREIKQGLLKSWQFVESREAAIIRQVKSRQAEQREGGQSYEF